MRRLVPLSLLLILLPALAAPCSLAMRKPGGHIPAPVSLFEGVVVEAESAQLPYTSTQNVPGTSVIVEITRSYHGPFAAGTHVAGHRFNACCLCNSGPVSVGDRVIVWANDASAPFNVDVLNHDDKPIIPLGLLALVTDVPKPLARMSSVSVRGHLPEREAQVLFERARVPPRETCEIRRSREFAMVSCGSAFHANDARFKVVFEKTSGTWVEIMRYQLDAETEAKLEADATQSAAAARSTSPVANHSGSTTS